MNESPSVYTNEGIKFDMETVYLNSNWLQTVIMHSINSNMYYLLLYQLIDAKFYLYPTMFSYKQLCIKYARKLALLCYWLCLYNVSNS